MRYTIKEVSEITGISKDSLRYYEKQGIVSPKRGENRYRYYDEADLLELQYVSVMKYASFSLAEIKDMIAVFRNTPSNSCNKLSKEMLLAKAEQINQKILNYQNILMLWDELMPMIQNSGVYFEKQEKINEFVKRIFKDIKEDKDFDNSFSNQTE